MIERATRPARPEAARLLALAGFALLALALIAFAAVLAVHAGRALAYPYSLDYGEGIVWQQMNDMLAGTAYRPIGVYPAIVFHYPPVFHLAAAGVTRLLALDPLAGGRLVEMLSTLAAATLVGVLAMRVLAGEAAPLVRRWCGVAAAALFLASDPVAAWGCLMRVDMLAVALGFAGLWCAIRAIGRPGWIHLAALCFVLSIFTKQIAVAAPAAAFLTLMAVRPRTALAGIGTTLVLGVGALIVLTVVTDGGFLVHVVTYNVNRLDPARLLYLLRPITEHIALLIAAAFGVGTAVRQIGTVIGDGAWRERIDRLAQQPAVAGAAMLLLFLALKTMMLPAIMKSGANFNYGIEWLGAVAMLAGRGMAPVVALAMGRTADVAVPRLLLVTVAVMMPLQMLAVPWPPFETVISAERAAALTTIVERVRASPRPVIADDMTLLLRAGQPVGWEPAIAAELAHTGGYDEAAFVRQVRAHAFGFFVTEGGPGELSFEDRYNPEVSAAILSAYPRTETVGGLTLRLPAKPHLAETKKPAP